MLNLGIHQKLFCSTAVAIIAAAFAAPAAGAMESPTVIVDIPPKSLGESLQTLGLIANRQLIFSGDIVSGRRGNGVSGSFTPEEALKRILDGTGLIYRETSAGVFLIQSSSGLPQQDGAAETSPARPIRTAAAEPTSSAPSRNESAAAAPHLEEIVVTATRRAETLSTIPLSVAAVNIEQLEKQGVKTFDDLVKFTPGLNLSRGGNGANQIAIRGISSQAGSATTGVYIDDVPIQVRNLDFSAGTLFPTIFDLDRVEVLRGPQGTLFGAGSEGGTVRFIQPEPSLTRSSVIFGAN
jgi:hypothetical protein